MEWVGRTWGCRRNLAVSMVFVIATALVAIWQVPATRAATALRGAWSLAVSEALIMTGTAMPVVTPEWMGFASRNFIVPTVGEGFTPAPVTTPAQWWPLTGLSSLTLNQVGSGILDDQLSALIVGNQSAGTPDDPITVFGYSQSSWIAAMQKQLSSQDAVLGEFTPPLNFVLLSNVIRPNGGFFSRFFGYGLITWAPLVSAPTQTPFPTYDISRQYDFFSDFPANPLNPFALVNATFGLMNHDYGGVSLDPDSPNWNPETMIDSYGDTTYYTVPSQLPMLKPLRLVGLGLLADVIEPVLKVLVELGYDRDTPYGQYTTFRLLPSFDLAELAEDLGAAFEESLAVLSPERSPASSQPPAGAIRATAPAPAGAIRATAPAPAGAAHKVRTTRTSAAAEPAAAAVAESGPVRTSDRAAAKVPQRASGEPRATTRAAR